MGRLRAVVLIALIVAGTLVVVDPAWAQSDSSADLAHKLQNPVADLISVPLQSNWDTTPSGRPAAPIGASGSPSPSCCRSEVPVAASMLEHHHATTSFRPDHP